MTDTLRTRIIAVLLEHPDNWDGSCCGNQHFTSMNQWAAHVADVLIRELRLTQERRSPIVTEAGMSVGNWLIPTESRYVTEWTADE